MSRQARLIVVMAIIALVAVGVLVGFANHYRSMAPAKSVTELSDESVGALGGRVARLEIFVVGRQAVREHWEKHPYAVKSILGEYHETEGRDKVIMHNEQMFGLRVYRRNTIVELGMDEPEYIEIRKQFRAYRAGDAAVDAAWKQTFDAHPEQVAAADLGDWDPLDL